MMQKKKKNNIIEMKELSHLRARIKWKKSETKENNSRNERNKKNV